jgi:hypothetical protein
MDRLERRQAVAELFARAVRRRAAARRQSRDSTESRATAVDVTPEDRQDEDQMILVVSHRNTLVARPVGFTTCKLAIGFDHHSIMLEQRGIEGCDDLRMCFNSAKETI